MYSVTVRIESIEKRRRSASMLHIVVGFFMILNASNYYQLTGYSHPWVVAPFLLVASVSLFYGFFRRKMDLSAHYNHWLRLLQVAAFAVMGWMVLDNGQPRVYIGVFIFVILCIVLLFSERKIFQETIVFFEDKGITIPGYYRNHLVKWEHISEVVVREDFLTIFHVDKKYLQFQVLQDLSTLEVTKLNAFCREKLNIESVSSNPGVGSR